MKKCLDRQGEGEIRYFRICKLLAVLLPLCSLKAAQNDAVHVDEQ